MAFGRTLTALVLLLAAGCGSEELETAASDEEVTHSGLYYVGDSFAGLQLTHAESVRERQGFFAYGDCEPPPDEGGCAPPLQVQNFPLAARHPGMFELLPGQPAACRRTSVRGVPAAVFETTGGALEVYAGRTVVVVWASPALAERAARALRRYRDGESTTGAALPPPPATVPRELRRCATDSLDTNLRALRRSAAAPIYWVGRHFRGHPLARVEGDANRARFLYGACARAPDYDADARCWAPLELVVEPLAARSPSRYAPAIECRHTRVRGVPVAVLPDAHAVEVFTGRTTVTLHASELSFMLAAAEALRTLDERGAASRQLDSPPPSLVETLVARCGPERP